MAENPRQLAQQAKEKAEQMLKHVLDSTPAPYRNYIHIFARDQRFGKGNSAVYETIRKPYMYVDGQVLMARDDHKEQGAQLDVITELIQAGENYIYKATVKSSLHGTVTAHSPVDFSIKERSAVDALKAAETNAIGRAHRFMGYAAFGSESDNSIETPDHQVEVDNPIPNMSGTPAPESDPKTLPARQGQIGRINGLLKKLGVRDKHKTKLRETLYPNGLTEDLADRLAAELESFGRLSGRWINPYMTMLLDAEPEKKKPTQIFMQEHFGSIRPGQFTHEQQLQLIAFVCDGEVPEEEDDQPDDIYLPGEVEQIEAAKVDAGEWASMIAGICSGTSIGSNLFAAWALQAHGNGQKDVTELSADVYNMLKNSDKQAIRASIFEYAAEAE